MAKPKPAEQTEKHKAWIAAEIERAEAEAAYQQKKTRAAELASVLGEEKQAEGKNAVEGPGGVVFKLMKARDEKTADGTKVAPPFPLVLRRAAELKL